MATYALTVSTNALGLGVLNGATVRIEKRRVAIADTYPPVNNLIQIAQATNPSGITSFLLEPDDLTTYHVAKIFDLAGVFIYQKSFTMPPSASNLHDSSISTVIGGSLIQFKENGNDLGTPTTVRNVDIIGTGTTATFAGDTVTLEINGNIGFVSITDITPTSPSDNVGAKVFTDDNNVLQSCTSSTTNVTVSVLAVTAGASFKPTVDVNGTAATLTRNAGTDVWIGNAEITLTGASPYTVTATHGQGAVDTATVTIEAVPVIDSLLLSNEYSQGVGQTEHAAGQTLSLTMTSTTPFVELQVIDDSTTATQAFSQTFAATTSHTITVTAANRGNTPTDYPAKVRIRNANGAWSAITESSNQIVLNNTQPSLSFNSIVYPVGQFALKDDESATVNVTESNVDTVSYSSPNGQISITDPTATGNKTVSRIAGGYNISTNNLSVTVGKTSNATSATFSAVVWIAHDAPTITITTPAARLRSGVTPQNHTISINSNQCTQATPTLSASVGTLSGAWSTANNGVTWTCSLSIADSDAKGAATFSGLNITNLAGIVVTSINSGDSYTVGGFTQRTITFSAYPNRESAIGTQVSNTSKLRVTNLSKGTSGSLNTNFVASVGDAIDTYTITNPTATYNATGNTLYNRDLANAVSNTTNNSMQFEVEELV